MLGLGPFPAVTKFLVGHPFYWFLQGSDGYLFFICGQVNFMDLRWAYSLFSYGAADYAYLNPFCSSERKTFYLNERLDIFLSQAVGLNRSAAIVIDKKGNPRLNEEKVTLSATSHCASRRCVYQRLGGFWPKKNLWTTEQLLLSTVMSM